MVVSLVVQSYYFESLSKADSQHHPLPVDLRLQAVRVPLHVCPEAVQLLEEPRPRPRAHRDLPGRPRPQAGRRGVGLHQRQQDERTLQAAGENRYKRYHLYSLEACVTRNVQSLVKTNNMIGPAS